MVEPLGAFYWAILSYEIAIRRDFKVTKNSKLKNRLIDRRFFTADFQSDRFFLSLIDFDRKSFKNRQHYFGLLSVQVHMVEVQDWLEDHHIDVMVPPYSWDFTPCDFWLFLTFKRKPWCKKCSNYLVAFCQKNSPERSRKNWSNVWRSLSWWMYGILKRIIRGSSFQVWGWVFPNKCNFVKFCLSFFQ